MNSSFRILIASLICAILLPAAAANAQTADGLEKQASNANQPIVLAQANQQLTPAQKKARAERQRRKRAAQQRAQQIKKQRQRNAAQKKKLNQQRAKQRQQLNQRRAKQRDNLNQQKAVKRKKINQQRALQRKKLNQQRALQQQRKLKQRRALQQQRNAAPNANRGVNERRARNLDQKQRALDAQRRRQIRQQQKTLPKNQPRVGVGRNPGANANANRRAQQQRRRNIKRRQTQVNRRAFNRLQKKRTNLRTQINRQRNRKVRLQRQNSRLARQRNWLRSQRNVARRRPFRNFGFRQRARVVDRRGDRTILTALAGAAVGAAIVGSYYVYHNDDNRIDWRSRDVYVDDLDNGWTRNVVIRPNGTRVVTIRDGGGFIVRRYRVYPGNRVTMLYDNQPRWWDEGDLAVEVAPARYSGPRDRYIVEPSTADVDTVYGAIVADPVDEIGRTYTLNQILVNANLRGYMPRIDLDSIAFASGSATIPESQLDRLDSIGAAMEAAIKDNPNEVYLIEGHTDLTGSDVDNLTLSDERASAVANALTEYYEIPPENLVTQGYGEEFPKIDRPGPESRNRRVAIRRITPLLANESDDIALDSEGNEVFEN